MELSDSLYKLFNRQYLTEIGNFGMYQNLANIAGNLAYKGFEKFFKDYALDEITHAQVIANFIIGRKRTPVVGTLQDPGIVYSENPLDWFKQALIKAKGYTAIIKETYEQCEKEKDYAASKFLNWYLIEQDRVEAILTDFINELERSGSTAYLLIINERLLGGK